MFIVILVAIGTGMVLCGWFMMQVAIFMGGGNFIPYCLNFTNPKIELWFNTEIVETVAYESHINDPKFPYIAYKHYSEKRTPFLLGNDGCIYNLNKSLAYDSLSWRKI